jgi:aldehyde:ferredoxin oxidoreductase
MRARYGYMGKMLFVDLSSGKVREEELTEELARDYIGGYGIGARIIMEHMLPCADPLGPDSILGIGTGPFTGSGTISTSRFITMGKSPLTGFWGDANSGGNFPAALKGAGYDFVFFQGKADCPVYVIVTDSKVEFKDARHLWGKNSVETEELIREENGDRSLKVACIGTAGEKLARIAAIMNDGGRAAARSGLGATMGSKNLKALACAGKKRPAVFNKAAVESLNKTMIKEIKENPGPGILILSKMGTAGAMVPHLALHATPIKNFAGNTAEDFPEAKWGKVGYEALEKYIARKYACTGCPIACGGILNVESGPYACKGAHKPEYETLGAFGPLCLVDDIEALVYANDLCNLHGLDTISAGCSIALAIECYEKGLITRNETDGLELVWGNAGAMVELLRKMCVREGVGDLFADGPREAARRIGRGAEELSMDVGGEGIPMHDPREADGWGATYVADPTPARHTRGGTQFAESGGANPRQMAMLGLPPTLPKYKAEGKGKAHAILRAWQHLINNTGLCLFCADALSYYPMKELMEAITGWKVTVDELIKTGMRTSAILHAFNLREGFKPGDFTMPSRAAGDPQFKKGPFANRTIDFEALKKEYYAAMGFDFGSGAIEQKRIKELGLQGILP